MSVRLTDHLIAWAVALLTVGLPGYLLGRLLGLGDGSPYWTVVGAVAIVVWLAVWGLAHERRPDWSDPNADGGRRWFFD